MENKSLGYFVDNNNIIIIRGYNYLVPLRILVLVSVMAFPSSNGGVYSFRFRTGIDGGGVKMFTHSVSGQESTGEGLRFAPKLTSWTL